MLVDKVAVGSRVGLSHVLQHRPDVLSLTRYVTLHLKGNSNFKEAMGREGRRRSGSRIFWPRPVCQLQPPPPLNVLLVGIFKRGGGSFCVCRCRCVCFFRGGGARSRGVRKTTFSSSFVGGLEGVVKSCIFGPP